jgi:hypothetical protein
VERGFAVYTESQERLERFGVVRANELCENAPSGDPALCGFFPENGVENLLELGVDLGKRVEVAVSVVTVLVAR